MAAPKKRPVELHSEYFDDDCASEGMGESEDGDPVEDTNLHWIGHLVIWKMEISEIGKVICFFFPLWTHSHWTNCQELGHNFPHGPDTVEELFDWSDFNSSTLFSSSSGGQSLRNNFIKLLSECDSIELHESYAGIGTAGIALVEQFTSMRSLVAGELPQRFLVSMQYQKKYVSFFFEPLTYPPPNPN